ncbi:MAG TPA: addiction module protein [Hanamia sp.]
MIDKSKIIDAIKKTDDEFILTEINQLLQHEIEIPDWHKKVLQQRLKDFEEGNVVFHNWEEVKNSIFAS